jgi:hypothetical protein
MRADVEVLGELVVPVVGAALRARVRVSAAVLGRSVPVLDGDVDTFGHGLRV